MKGVKHCNTIPSMLLGLRFVCYLLCLVSWHFSEYFLTTGLCPSASFVPSIIQIIPHVVKGPWVVKKGVGNVPCLLGQKVMNIYIIKVLVWCWSHPAMYVTKVLTLEPWKKVSIRVFRGAGYCETNVEMTNPIAKTVLSNCRGTTFYFRR